MSAVLTDADFARAAKDAERRDAAIRAVAEVEAAGAGFLPDGRPAMLYEAHIFHKHKGAHADANDRRGVNFQFAEMEPLALWRDRRGAAQPL